MARRTKLFDESLSTRYEKFHGIVNIRDPETLGFANHAAQHRVFLVCPRISQLIKTVTSSVLDHDSSQQFGHSLLLPLHLIRRAASTSLRTLERYDTSKKGLLYSIKIGSPKKLHTVSTLSQSSRLVPLQYKITESPATNPCSHHLATDKAAGFKWRRAVELCPHSLRISGYADGGRALELQF